MTAHFLSFLRGAAVVALALAAVEPSARANAQPAPNTGQSSKGPASDRPTVLIAVTGQQIAMPILRNHCRSDPAADAKITAELLGKHDQTELRQVLVTVECGALRDMKAGKPRRDYESLSYHEPRNAVELPKDKGEAAKHLCSAMKASGAAETKLTTTIPTDRAKELHATFLKVPGSDVSAILQRTRRACYLGEISWIGEGADRVAAHQVQAMTVVKGQLVIINGIALSGSTPLDAILNRVGAIVSDMAKVNGED